MREEEINEKSKGLYYNVNKRKKAGTSRKQGHPEAPSAQDWKNAAKTAKETTNEGLAELAGAAERDHEVQMARADLYKLAKYAIKLHDMLKGVSEAEGLEGWVQSKITKSADMIGSVYHHMDYDEAMDEVIESKKDDEFEPHMMYDPKTGKGYKANKEQDHKDMAKKGYTHDKPKKADIKEAEKRWKQTSMSSAEATKKYGKENVKVKKGGLNNGDDMVEVFVEGESKEPEKMKVTNADKKMNTTAYQRMKKGDKRYIDATTESLQDKLADKLEGKFKSDAHRKAVHAGKASGKKAKKSLRK